MDGSLLLGNKAFNWLLDHLERFVEPAEMTVPARILRAKRLAELAVLGSALEGSVAGAAKLAPLAWSALGEGTAIAPLLKHQPTIVATYLPFREAGLRSVSLEGNLADPSWRRGHERWSLFGRYAIGVTLESIGISPPWDQAAVLASRRLFASPDEQTPPLDAALLAHAVMWRTRMGRAPWALGDQTTARFLELVPAWSRLLQASQLLDPLGEIVIANICAGGPPQPESLACLIAAQRPDGSVPPHPTAQDDSFEATYHSTLVAAIAGIFVATAAAKRTNRSTPAVLSAVFDAYAL